MYPRRGLEIGRRPVVQSIFVYLEQIKILFIKKNIYIYIYMYVSRINVDVVSSRFRLRLVYAPPPFLSHLRTMSVYDESLFSFLNHPIYWKVRY